MRLSKKTILNLSVALCCLSMSIPTFANPKLNSITEQINSLDVAITQTSSVIEGLIDKQDDFYEQLENSDIIFDDLQTELKSITESKTFLEEELEEYKVTLEDLKLKKQEIEKEILKEKENESLKNEAMAKLKSKPLGNYRITAYDLSVNSCGKAIGSKGYGVTSSGYSLKGMTRAEAMTVAVDPKVIPIGSKIYMEFPSGLSQYNGIYTARDKGGAIKGKRIDLFYGDFNRNTTHPSVMDFGVRYANIYLVDSSVDLSLLDNIAMQK